MHESELVQAIPLNQLSSDPRGTMADERVHVFPSNTSPKSCSGLLTPAPTAIQNVGLVHVTLPNGVSLPPGSGVERMDQLLPSYSSASGSANLELALDEPTAMQNEMLKQDT